MTEAEWLASKDACQMLWGDQRTNFSPRKLRLFACAVSRRLWNRFDQEDIHRAVELAELVADERAPANKLQPACDAAFKSVRRREAIRAPWAAANSAYPDAWHAAAACATQAGMTGLRKAGVTAIFREVFGNPFRAVTLDRRWLTADVVALARSAYEERALPSGELDSVRLAVLADAVEEAGCSDASLLDHLRSPGPHVCGCWGLDLLLGKK
ncbi:hypothetical protein VT84_26180 [Gemmata sp. SH-PL17]|uniref:hypothetical protein n=1 Tax=Gemmata sp. SH-PL17 TaxID=1630693 RepID=UPI000698C53F|nr:hypothetical protein [Gemmata sp. SH-PL17]AMV27919.1 hypothetical protein VT84_26180 [Gemmata sp. SH-PL17]